MDQLSQRLLRGESMFLTLFHCFIYVSERITATAASPSKDLGRGPIVLLNCVHRTARWTHMTYNVFVGR